MSIASKVNELTEQLKEMNKNLSEIVNSLKVIQRDIGSIKEETKRIGRK